MSSFQQKHSDALLASPWLAKRDSDGKTWLMKYADHPDRRGYVFLASDLNRVLFESLTAPSVPSRLAETANLSPSSSRPKASSQSSSTTDVTDTMRLAEEKLDEVRGMMSGDGWEDAGLEVQSHDFFDASLVVSSGSFTWIFNTTELRDTHPLTILSAHLLKPLALLLASSRSIRVPAAAQKTPAEILGRLLDVSTIGDEMISLAGPSSSTPAPVPSQRISTPKKRKESPQPKTRNEEEKEEEGSEDDHDDEQVVEDQPEEGDEASRSASPIKAPPPRHVTRQTTSSPPPSKPEPRSTRSHPDPPASTSSPPSKRGGAKTKVAEEEDGEEEAGTKDTQGDKEAGEEMPRPSQKSKREREAEEEAAVEARLEALRQKRGGGGRLSRRRGH